MIGKRLLAQRSQWSPAIQFLLLEYFPDGGRAYGVNVVMQAVTPENQGYAWEPTFSIGTTEAQELMDSLWQCGLRPSEGIGSAGQLASTQKHLEDMRTIAFKFLEIK